ncbi:hypothetical protein HUB97_03240 [Halorubraceae archaeon YAN]|nr:hypothetical protein [Halorubraceae archaeon YAN]
MGPKPPLCVHVGECSTDEIVAALNEDRRVRITVEMMGTERIVTLRRDGNTYYCDTPTKLLKHTGETEIRNCIKRMGYARPDE